MDELGDLIARVEGATGADREIDIAIACAVRNPPIGVSRSTWESWPGQDGRFTGLIHCGGFTIERPPEFTASLDAALALCERVLPSVFWNVGVSDTKAPRYSADVACPGSGERPGYTPALAVLSALLRALQAATPLPTTDGGR
jgi:hypothetical protein